MIRLSGTEYVLKRRPKEVDIQRDILQYLSIKGIFNFRVNTGGVMRMGRWCPSPTITKGTSDIIAIKKLASGIGQFVAIEVKAQGGKVSKDQRAFLDSVVEGGGLAVVAYGVHDVRVVFES